MATDKGGDEKPSLAPSLVPEYRKRCYDDVNWIPDVALFLLGSDG